jgi:ATP-dependent DNA ligase
MPPVKPMLAKSVSGVPDPDTAPGGLLYEPKWDGFRCIVFRDGDEVVLGSRNERPLTRYFPEVVDAVRAQLPPRCVVDGEIVVARGGGLDFDALQQRIHPAESRVRLLASTTPAAFVAFDLLALDDDDLTEEPFQRRRALLEAALAQAQPPVFLTPATADPELARRWFDQFEGAGLDGVVAKPLAAPYRQDQRVMVKVKHERTADCVVAGFRWHKSGPVVGSLLLGLYDDEGMLQHVGVVGAFPMRRRAELVDELAPYRVEDLSGHPWAEWAEAAAEEGAGSRMPGAVSRWNADKDLSWVPLRPELVVEVAYDHLQGTRFRHTAQFRRWRADREPRSCTYAQLERPVSFDLAAVLSG